MNGKIKRVLMFSVEHDLPTMLTGDECDQVLTEIERLRSQLSAYENDLVLLDVMSKYEAEVKEVENLIRAGNKVVNQLTQLTESDTQNAMTEWLYIIRKIKEQR